MYFLLYRIQLLSETLVTEIKDWLFLTRIISTPKCYQFNDKEEKPFDFLEILSSLTTLVEQKKWQLKIISEQGEFQLQYEEQKLLERFILSNTNFFTYQDIIENYIEVKLPKNGVYGYIRSFDEFLYHNIQAIDQRTFENQQEIDALPKCYNEKKEVVIDCNQLAGYDLYYKGLCFTSCWKMYVSKQYYKVIPKPIFLELQHVESIEELEDEAIKVTLFHHPLNWGLPVNKNDQRITRDQMGIDQLTWTNGVGVLREPMIEFLRLDQHIQTVQYLNDHLQPVIKKEATNFLIRSYDAMTENFIERRVKGKLNAQAYFPWVDKNNYKMMNYRVLNPELTLDQGLKAYEFYIRQFLEVNIEDTQYDRFTLILQFYLPKETLEKLPLHLIKDALNDVKIQLIEAKDVPVGFDLVKGNNHLRVLFLDIKQLRQ